MGELEWQPATASALGAWADALEASEAVDRSGEVIRREDLEEQLALSYVDAARDTRLGWIGEQVVAYGIVWSIPSKRQRRVMLGGGIVPECRGEGIGTELIGWLIERGLEVAAAGEPGTPGWLELFASEHDVDRESLFAALGFTPLRYYFQMRRPLAPDLPSPDGAAGFTLVPYDFGLDDAVRRAHNEAFRDHFASTEFDAETWQFLVTDRHFRADASFVVLDGDEVVGYALNSIYPDEWEALGYSEGWTHQLGVRRPWRGRGIAKALLGATAGAFAREGLGYATLDVDAENPTGALALYEGSGYTRARTRVAWSRPVD